jgi:hypothetical protein
MRKPYRGIVILAMLAAPGCRGLLTNEGDSPGRKTAKVAGRVVQGVATWGGSEAIYAGRRARR